MEAALKAEREKKVKVYRQKYDIYLQMKPTTSSPFDALIAAAQVRKLDIICFTRGKCFEKCINYVT
jgi:hypothetical protein